MRLNISRLLSLETTLFISDKADGTDDNVASVWSCNLQDILQQHCFTIFYKNTAYYICLQNNADLRQMLEMMSDEFSAIFSDIWRR